MKCQKRWAVHFLKIIEKDSMFMNRKICTVKMSVPPNLTYRLNATPVTILANYIVEIDKVILKFI